MTFINEAKLLKLAQPNLPQVRQTRHAPIYLALSGGGTRAMVFHAGVLKSLAEHNQLERVERISSVSGGSLFVGLVYSLNHWHWPTSSEYLNTVLPKLKHVLVSTNLQRSTGLAILSPKHWPDFFSRANVLAKVIEQLWGIPKKMGELPVFPHWSINATSAETGKRFRFDRQTFGDYQTGYCNAQGVPLSQALAVSAALPGSIGPLRLNVSEHDWKKQADWNNPNSVRDFTPSYHHLHLYDGALYDNLGLEPFFDVGKGEAKFEQGYLLVSDAGKKFKTTQLNGPFNPFRIRRIFDICFDQSRALRVRSLVNYLKQNEQRGCYLKIGANDQAHLAEYPTNLKSMSASMFEQLLTHSRNLMESRFSHQVIREQL